MFRLAIVLRRATQLDEPTANAFSRRHQVRILRSEGIAVPLTLSILPQRIFVPPNWDRWSTRCREQVLLHELAHLRRGDGIVQMLQVWTRAIYLFHPLVWILNRRLDTIREMACDDAASGFGRESRLVYSRSLIEVVESMVARPAPSESASTLLRRKHELLRRIQYQTEGDSMFPISNRKKGAALAAVLFLIFGLSWYGAGASQETEEPGNTGKSGKQPVSESTTSSAPITKDIYVEATLEGEGEGAIRIETMVSSLDGFGDDIDEAVADDKQHTVIRLSCEEQVTMGRIHTIQQMLRERGLIRILYVTPDGRDLGLVLPPLGYREKQKEIDPKHFARLVITGSEGMRLDGETIPKDKVETAIRGRLAADDMLIVAILAQEDAAYGDFVGMLDLAKKAGATRILIDDPSS